MPCGRRPTSTSCAAGGADVRSTAATASLAGRAANSLPVGEIHTSAAPVGKAMTDALVLAARSTTVNPRLIGT